MIEGNAALDLLHDKYLPRKIDRILSKRHLIEFIKIAWNAVEPAKPFVNNWHIEAMCEHLEAALKGEIKRLVINVPPGTMKSLTCSVFLPAWEWGPGERPGTKFIYASYSDRIAYRDSLRTRRLIENLIYRARWGTEFNLIDRTAGRLSNDMGGWRLATTVRGGITGEHADVQIVDDPIKPFEVTRSMSVAQRALEDVISWWDETMSSRLVDIMNSVRIIIMQRLHCNDLAGYVLKDMGYEHLMLPMEFESSRRCTTSIGFTDPRTEEGELLFEKRFPKEAVDRQKKEMGSRASRAQHQQDPVDNEGNIIKKEWIKYWQKIPALADFLMIIQSWDCTFADSDNTDFVAGHVWGYTHDHKRMLLDRFHKRANIIDTLNGVRLLSTRWPKSYTKLVEQKANGQAVVDLLNDELTGLKLVNPEGGKIARVHAVEPVWERGEVYLPDPKMYPWSAEVEAEITGFPSREHDDDVDAMTQALIYFERKSLLKLQKALAKAGVGG